MSLGWSFWSFPPGAGRLPLAGAQRGGFSGPTIPDPSRREARLSPGQSEALPPQLARRRTAAAWGSGEPASSSSSASSPSPRSPTSKTAKSGKNQRLPRKMV
ncbi:PREDICTED: uncharacterized protein LOC106898934 isoform X1 [Calidris pugnax]|uniref:uncharacterized protein LOC106898934 isoform X1 n=1 Tax=Calidris pugnax TaxID=198806 RepID=UPI00071C85F2|nr:PREDICTED: uncharacterized protein LOC106898934 isoform X1 [Calidris pugnax]